MRIKEGGDAKNLSFQRKSFLVKVFIACKKVVRR
jgi:hypothetical protein